MKKNILFVIVPTFAYSKFINPSENDFYDITPTGKKARMTVGGMPTGILSMASYIKKVNQNIGIRIIDFNLIINKLVKTCEIDRYSSFGEIYAEKIQQYKEFKPDIIALSAIFNSSFECIKECAEIIENQLDESIIVLGGGLATNGYKKILDSITQIYATCVGEGEVPLAEIISTDNITNNIESNKSFVTRNKLNNNFTVAPTFLEDLDEIPPFDYSLISFDEYAESSLYGNIISNKSINKVLNICSTRGCLHKCTFCCSHSIHGRKIRYHSADRIIEDIQYSIDHFGINTVTFNDDNFLYDRKRALKILEYLKDKNLDVTFPNGFTIYRIDEEVAFALRDAGVKEASLALESGNQETLKYIIKKPVKLQMVKPAIESLRKANIYVRGFFMIGFPGETKDSIQESIDFMSKLDFNWVMIYVVTPFLGSELYELCQDKKYLTENSSEQIFCQGTIRTPEFEPEYIAKVAYTTNLKINFVNNYDMRVGNYEFALMRFEKIIKQAKDHAVAFYCAALCCSALGYKEKESEYKKEVGRIVKDSIIWKEYMEELKIDLCLI